MLDEALLCGSSAGIVWELRGFSFVGSVQLSGNDVQSVGCAERKFLAGVRAVKSLQTWRLTGSLGEPVEHWVLEIFRAQQRENVYRSSWYWDQFLPDSGRISVRSETQESFQAKAPPHCLLPGTAVGVCIAPCVSGKSLSLSAWYRCLYLWWGCLVSFIFGSGGYSVCVTPMKGAPGKDMFLMTICIVLCPPVLKRGKFGAL